MPRLRTPQLIQEQEILPLDKPEFKSDLSKIRNTSEFAELVQFLMFFGSIFKISNVDIEELEEELVGAAPKGTAVTNIMKEFISFLGIQRINIRKFIKDEEWNKACWTMLDGVFDENPLGETVENASEWSELSYNWKIDTLYMWMKKITFSSPFASKLEALNEKNPGSIYRVDPVGFKGDTVKYFLLDDNRLYYSELKKPKMTKNATGVIIDEEGRWKCVCVTLDEWEATVAKFTKSRNAEEKQLGRYLESDILPILKENERERVKAAHNREKRRVTEAMEKRTSSRIELQKQRKQELAKQQELEMSERLNERRAKREKIKLEQDREERLVKRDLKRSRMSTPMTDNDDSETPNKRPRREVTRVTRPTRSTVSIVSSTGGPRKLGPPPTRNDPIYFDCICGVHGDSLDDGSMQIRCNRCHVWFHTACLDDKIEFENIIEKAKEQVENNLDADTKENPEEDSNEVKNEQSEEDVKAEQNGEQNGDITDNKQNGAEPKKFKIDGDYVSSYNSWRCERCIVQEEHRLEEERLEKVREAKREERRRIKEEKERLLAEKKEADKLRRKARKEELKKQKEEQMRLEREALASRNTIISQPPAMTRPQSIPPNTLPPSNGVMFVQNPPIQANGYAPTHISQNPPGPYNNGEYSMNHHQNGYPNQMPYSHPQQYSGHAPVIHTSPPPPPPPPSHVYQQPLPLPAPMPGAHTVLHNPAPSHSMPPQPHHNLPMNGIHHSPSPINHSPSPIPHYTSMPPQHLPHPSISNGGQPIYGQDPGMTRGPGMPSISAPVQPGASPHQIPIQANVGGYAPTTVGPVQNGARISLPAPSNTNGGVTPDSRIPSGGPAMFTTIPYTPPKGT